MDNQVKRIKRELIRSGAILDIYTDTMELPDGKVEEWDFVSHRKGAAAVVPVRDDGKILMVRQYRNALDRAHDFGDTGGVPRQRDRGYKNLCGERA